MSQLLFSDNLVVFPVVQPKAEAEDEQWFHARTIIMPVVTVPKNLNGKVTKHLTALPKSRLHKLALKLRTMFRRADACLEAIALTVVITETERIVGYENVQSFEGGVTEIQADRKYDPRGFTVKGYYDHDKQHGSISLYRPPTDDEVGACP